MELIQFLEPWWQAKIKGIGGAAVAAAEGIQFGGTPTPYTYGPDNEGGWLYVVLADSTDIDYGENAGLIADKTGLGIQILSRDAGNTKQGVVERTPDLVELSLSSDVNLALARGTGIVANLSVTGRTLVVNDHLGSPLVTYTG